MVLSLYGFAGSLQKDLRKSKKIVDLPPWLEVKEEFVELLEHLSLDGYSCNCLIDIRERGYIWLGV